MTHLNEALQRLERRAARYAKSSGPIREPSDDRSADAARLPQQAEIITVVVELDRELTVGRCVRRLEPVHPPSPGLRSPGLPSPGLPSPGIAHNSPAPVPEPPERIRTIPASVTASRGELPADPPVTANPPVVVTASHPTSVDAPIADPAVRAVTTGQTLETTEPRPAAQPQQPLVERPAAPVRAPVSIKSPTQAVETQAVDQTDYDAATVESSTVELSTVESSAVEASIAEVESRIAEFESRITDVESRGAPTPITDDTTSRPAERTEPATPQYPTTAPENDEDEFHKTCRNLLAHMSEASCPVVLLASEEGQAGTVDLVEKLMVTLAELSEAPVLAMDACGERLGQRFNVIAGGENRTSHDGSSWSDGIVQTTSPGLCLLSMGPSQTSVPAKRLHEQFNELKSRFGLIAIDAGATTNAHTCSLSTAAEGSLFLVRLDVTTEDWMIQARDRVTAWGASPMGAIVTIPQRAAA